MTITGGGIERYLELLQPGRPEFILKMERASEQSGFPIVGPLVGGLLTLIAKMHIPALVVEVGSGFGYSAWWFAQGLEGGRVVLTDHDPENIAAAKEMFTTAGLRDRAEFHKGDGVEIASGYDKIDILFLDHEKKRYLAALKKLSGNIAPGGLVIADNTLWHERVLTGEDDEALAIREFNTYLFSEESGFDCTLVPLRDGVLIGRKKD